MLRITPAQLETLHPRLRPEREHIITWHILKTGHGQCYVDRWPAARALLSTIGMLGSLSGDPEALPPDDLREHLAGLVHASSRFLPLIKTVFPEVRGIERVMLELQDRPAFSVPPGVNLRRLAAEDADQLAALPPDLAWISHTWGGPAGLAASGYAWGAFRGEKLASLAGTFLVGDEFEDIGVVTLAEDRGQGLAALCASALCQDIQGRGRRASWTTSSDNSASLRVAEKLGFKRQEPEVLYALGRF